jgi:hypothetical protein
MRWPTLVLVALIALLQYPLWLGKGGWIRVWEVERQAQAQREVNQKLEQRNAALDAEVRDLKIRLRGHRGARPLRTGLHQAGRGLRPGAAEKAMNLDSLRRAAATRARRGSGVARLIHPDWHISR